METSSRQMRFERRMLKRDTMELRLAIAAYECGGESLDSILNEMMRVTGWSRTVAAYFYDKFEDEGLKLWKRLVSKWTVECEEETGNE